MSLCDLTNRDPAGCVEISALLNCDLVFPEDGGLCFGAPTTVHDKHGHKLDGDWDPAGHRGCNHRETPEWRSEHPPVRRNVGQRAEWDAGTPDAGEPVQEPQMAEAAHNEPVAPAPAVTETIGVDAAVSQVKALVPADTSPALLLGGAAVLAVIGAAIKLGPGFLKARAEAKEREHEARMKELEIRERESEKKQDDHGSCATERAALATKVTGVETKIATVEAKVDEVGRKVEKAVASMPTLDGEFDPEAIEDRISRLEKAAKANKAAKPAPRKR
jgi:hypothetical protein